MSASPMSATETASAHRAFEAALSRIDTCLPYHFRHWPCGRRDEAINDVGSVTWVAWHGLLRLGKDPVSVGVTAIAANASRAVRKARAFSILDPRRHREWEVAPIRMRGGAFMGSTSRPT
jgi:hypothetical protein